MDTEKAKWLAEIPANTLGRVAVVQMSRPDIKAAEDEVIARIKNTCDFLGLELIIIDTTGKQVDYPHKKVMPDDVDFVIHLHFETPKTYDAYSIVALWNPLDFYFEWGYRRYSDNLLTHDDFLSCGSQSADDHINRMLLNSNSHLKPKLQLFHSLPPPYYEPDLGQQKLFYVGINWERIGNKPGRHDELLKSLDATGDLVIYGPKIFQGVDVWEGYSSYVGPIPFDGVSIIKAIHKAGISLVLSSDAHRKAGLMSSRLFESLAAGAVIIVDENSFAREHFGDTLLYIKTENVAPESITKQVREHLDWIDSNKEEALDLAKKAQKIFFEKFDMSLSFKKIYSELPERKRKLNEKYLSLDDGLSISIFSLNFKFDKNLLKSSVENFEKQSYKNKKLIIIVDKLESEIYGDEISKIIGNNSSISIDAINYFKRDERKKILGRVDLGFCISQSVNKLSYGDLYSFMAPNESLFSNHYSSLVRPFENDKELEVSYSDILLSHRNNGRKHYDLVKGVLVFGAQSNFPIGFSRFLFKKSKDNWIDTVVKYMKCRIVDFVYYKSDKKIRVSRASCEIDIGDLFFSQSDLENNNDLDLLKEALSEKSLKKLNHILAPSNGSVVYNDRVNFKHHSFEERQEIIAQLLESLSLPKWLLFIIRKTHSAFRKKEK